MYWSSSRYVETLFQFLITVGVLYSFNIDPDKISRASASKIAFQHVHPSRITIQYRVSQLSCSILRVQFFLVDFRLPYLGYLFPVSPSHVAFFSGWIFVVSCRFYFFRFRRREGDFAVTDLPAPLQTAWSQSHPDGL